MSAHLLILIMLFLLYLFFAPHKVEESDEILPDIWDEKIDSIGKEELKD